MFISIPCQKNPVHSPPSFRKDKKDFLHRNFFSFSEHKPRPQKETVSADSISLIHRINGLVHPGPYKFRQVGRFYYGGKALIKCNFRSRHRDFCGYFPDLF